MRKEARRYRKGKEQGSREGERGAERSSYYQVLRGWVQTRGFKFRPLGLLLSLFRHPFSSAF
jgi:hypothetical protein